jgi:uncharacterized protein YecE (DUF72 family)
MRAGTTAAHSCSRPDDARLISPTAAPKRASRDVFCYFDNDLKVRAPFDARRLPEKLLKKLSGISVGRATQLRKSMLNWR